MKVLHVIPTLGSGGAEKMLVDLTEEMKAKNIKVEVLVLTDQNDFFSKKLINMNVPVYFSDVNKIYHLLNLKVIRSYLKKDYDIVHAHLFAPQLFIALIRKTIKTKTKYVTTEHSTQNRRRKNKIFKPLDKWMYGFFDNIIGISKSTKVELNSYLPSTTSKTKIISNGIRLSDFENIQHLNPRELVNNYKKDDVLVLMVAAMRKEKDHETLIRAAKLLPSNYHVVFVGEGERLDVLKQYTAINGSTNVHFLGRRSDVPSIMKTCDVFVLSSHWEGFGLVAVEAMAAGLPTIVSDVEGLRDVVGSAGVLFSPGDHKKLADEIVTLMESQETYNYYVKKAEARYKLFDIKETAKQYIQMYKDIV